MVKENEGHCYYMNKILSFTFQTFKDSVELNNVFKI